MALHCCHPCTFARADAAMCVGDVLCKRRVEWSWTLPQFYEEEACVLSALMRTLKACALLILLWFWRISWTTTYKNVLYEWNKFDQPSHLTRWDLWRELERISRVQLGSCWTRRHWIPTYNFSFQLGLSYYSCLSMVLTSSSINTILRRSTGCVLQLG